VGPVYRSYGYHVYGYPSYVYRPYLFRPHLSIGFGFFAGYYVPYSYSYPDYYPYPYSYGAYASPYGPYGYPNTGYPEEYQQGSVTAAPQQLPQGQAQGQAPGPQTAGGVTFEVNPPTAQVSVDGQQVGTVQDFDGTKQPLTLAAGQHRIEIRAEGYQVVSFDVNVLAGQVIPYRGDLQQQ
jgi:hypothetical protein